MKIFICLFFLSFSIFGFSCLEVKQVSYPKIESLEDFEIDSQLDKGEEEMLQGNFECANEIFTEVMQLCGNDEASSIRLCRALFDQAIALAVMDKEQQALETFATLNTTLASFQCHDEENSQNEIYLVGNKPIIGEDEIAIEECLKRVENSRDMAMLIIGYAPVSKQICFSLTGALIVTVNKAKACCLSGGIWKACLQPLLQKWWDLKMWEQEWKRNFRVEPPCWD